MFSRLHAATADGSRISVIQCAVVAALAVAAGLASWISAAPPAEDASDLVALMQTYQHVATRGRLMKAPGADVGPAGLAQQAQAASAMDSLADCSLDYEPLDQQMRQRALELIGNVPHRAICKPAMSDVPASLLSGGSRAADRGHVSVMSKVTDINLNWAMAVPIIYLVLVGAFLLRMTMNILVNEPAAAKKDSQQSGYRPKRRLETESWNRGLIGWLSIDWANQWVARWGNSETADLTQIKAEELEALGDEQDEPARNYPRLKEIWDAEVRQKGLESASLIMTMIRFATWRRILKICLWTTGYEMIMYLGPPLAMQWVISYMEWLYTTRLTGVEVEQSALVAPTILTIVIFTGMPLFMAASNTVSAFLSQRLGVQCCGALSCLVFHTAQCLPEKHQENREEPDSDDEEDSDDDDILKDVYDGNNNWQGPKHFNLVQVISNDINMQFIALPLMAARALIILPVLIILMILVWQMIRATMLIVIAVAGLFTFATMLMVRQQMAYMLAFNQCAGHRLHFLEGIMFNIRTVKACGWVEVVQNRILRLRGQELKALEMFYWRLGHMYNISLMMPRVMILVAVWGYYYLYPGAQRMNIFATLPLLFTMQSALNNLVQTLPALVNCRPAIVRCEMFLKQAKAPTGIPRDEQLPDWLSVWPEDKEATTPGRLQTLSEERETEVEPQTHKLRFQGSWKRRENGRLVLKNMDITLNPGESMAIMGKVGAGKSTLLQGMLGELYPEGDARLEAPRSSCYSSQVPFITEDTLRENVLFGSALDEEHYNMVISGASLLPDLEVLPGGDNVPIGSRGISLSGGQKARVSLARMAYASKAEGVVLMDDPFGAVDAMTAKHILNNLIHGKVLEGRTKVVACQPEAERIMAFDKVAIIEKGVIAVQGTPAQVMKTEIYLGLLNSHQLASETDPFAVTQQESSDGVVQSHSAMNMRQSEPFLLREEEIQGRMEWKTIDYFCSIGRWWVIWICVFFYLLMQVASLMSNITLQHWSSDQILLQSGLRDEIPSAGSYLRGYVIWMFTSMVLFTICWHAGVTFTLRMSGISHQYAMDALLNAPIDKFFDRTPVGRIMNRLASDLMNLDTRTFNQITTCIGLTWQTLVPLVYVHMLLPIYFTAFTLPWYYLMFQIVKRYWNTMVPMRYLCHTAKSKMDNIITEVETGNISVRAMQNSSFMLGRFVEFLEDTMKAEVTCTLVLSRWLVNRLFIMSGFFITALVLLSIWVPNVISFGGLGLCLTNCFVLVTAIEMWMSMAAGAQYQFISMNRLHEYSHLPQEKAKFHEGDEIYRSWALNLSREDVGTESFVREDTPEGLIRIVKVGENGRREVILEQVPGEPAFRGPDGGGLESFCPKTKQLKYTSKAHRITAFSGVRHDVEKMTEELLRPLSEAKSWWDRWLKCDIQSEWMVHGCEVKVQDLRVGYGDIPRDILQNVSFTVAPTTKVGVVGQTGCGKSTLMLSLLRILEPRGGSIKLNGVDSTHIGLDTLRMSIGMVPQDPVLLAGSLRDSIDPFQFYTDNEVWRGLRLVQMEAVVRAMEWGLYTPLAGEGTNLSYGQRQLLCLARCVIRQPSLMLLDEATSALDPNTQELVQKTIENEFPKSTLICIAHRLETILSFDQIIVLDSGSLLESGTVEELKARKGGRFAQMLAAKKTW